MGWLDSDYGVGDEMTIQLKPEKPRVQYRGPEVGYKLTSQRFVIYGDTLDQVYAAWSEWGHGLFEENNQCARESFDCPN